MDCCACIWLTKFFLHCKLAFNLHKISYKGSRELFRELFKLRKEHNKF